MVDVSAKLICKKMDVMFFYESMKDVWTPRIAEVLSVAVDTTNRHHRFVVAILRTGVIVGYVPTEVISHGGRITCKVTGKRKFGKGLEVPCVYSFYGTERKIVKLKQLLGSEKMT